MTSSSSPVLARFHSIDFITRSPLPSVSSVSPVRFEVVWDLISGSGVKNPRGGGLRLTDGAGEAAATIPRLRRSSVAEVELTLRNVGPEA